MTAFYRPAAGVETQPFATIQLQDGQPHAGSDFGITDATGKRRPEVFAAESGTVLYAGDSRELGWPNAWYFNPDFDRSDARDSSAGNVLVIGHRDGVTTYCHLSAFRVKAGDKVTRGQHVAMIGATGNAYGEHLHFEWIPYRSATNKTFNFYTATYGRARPSFNTSINTQGTPVPATRGPLMALSDNDQTELLTKVRELHRDYSQGITGVRRDGDSFSVLRQLAAKAGIKIDEAARALKYGKK